MRGTALAVAALFACVATCVAQEDGAGVEPVAPPPAAAEQEPIRAAPPVAGPALTGEEYIVDDAARLRGLNALAELGAAHGDRILATEQGRPIITRDSDGKASIGRVGQAAGSAFSVRHRRHSWWYDGQDEADRQPSSNPFP